MKGCLKGILFLIIFILIIMIIGYWVYTSLTLEKLGKADEPGILGFVEDNELSQKTARELGIHDLTLKELVDYLKGVFKRNKENTEGAKQGTTGSVLYEYNYLI